MKRLLVLYYLLLFSFALNLSAQKSSTQHQTPYHHNEWLKFRVHYGFVNAGYATLKLKESNKNGQEFFHAVGKGWTVGAASLFFKIRDTYESYFTKGSIVKPYYFKRRVDEGGYTIKRNLTFYQNPKKVVVEDLQKDTISTFQVPAVQDMISAFYHLRNVDISNIKPGDEISINLFFDNEVFPFKLRFKSQEVLNTKFGKLNTWLIQPLVQKGRVFRAEESLEIWVTNDVNKIPIRVKASLAVGSLKADLDDYRNLVAPLPLVE